MVYTDDHPMFRTQTGVQRRRLISNWLRVFRSADASRIGRDGRQQLHMRAVRSEKCVVLRGRAWDGNAVIAAFFCPCAPYALTSHVSVFSHYFKGFDRFVKLVTSSIGEHGDAGEKRRTPVEWPGITAVPLPGLKASPGQKQVVHLSWLVVPHPPV